MRKLNRLPAGFCLTCLFLLWGCSSQPEKLKEASAPQAKPAKVESEFETGRAAFQRMYVSARTWSADAQPVRLESRPTKE
ncbi:MAG TPA: hypothetical protein VMZ25_06835, partial [Terriglobales bacterium]|nr:hypothetical protein [Terriglobales bacterium]